MSSGVLGAADARASWPPSRSGHREPEAIDRGEGTTLITGELEHRIDAVWNDVWPGGISNAITGTDLQGIPAALLRDADAGADGLDDDFVVWGLELVEGA